MTHDYVPPEGTKVKTVGTVYADPEGSGLLTLRYGNFEKLPAGSVGVVEDYEVYFYTTILIVRFPGNLRARLGPSAWELA